VIGLIEENARIVPIADDQGPQGHPQRGQCHLFGCDRSCFAAVIARRIGIARRRAPVQVRQMCEALAALIGVEHDRAVLIKM
jgi:hypothetical protein